jgi:hypothetical protein
MPSTIPYERERHGKPGSGWKRCLGGHLPLHELRQNHRCEFD